MRIERLARITFLTLFCLLLGIVETCSAQAQPDQQPTSKSEEEFPRVFPAKSDVRKIFEVKYQNVNQLVDVLRVFGVAIQPNSTLNVISAMGPREAVAAVEDAIRRLDVPPPPTRNIELIAYLLAASEQASEKNTPPELDPVTTQLKSIFKYQGFRLLETLVVRCRDRGAGSVTAIAPGPPEALKTLYDFSFDSATITADNSGKTIRIDR